MAAIVSLVKFYAACKTEPVSVSNLVNELSGFL